MLQPDLCHRIGAAIKQNLSLESNFAIAVTAGNSKLDWCQTSLNLRSPHHIYRIDGKSSKMIKQKSLAITIKPTESLICQALMMRSVGRSLRKIQPNWSRPIFTKRQQT